ncbi:SAF domain-containing protein [Streptantibioticus ferralitis]|uniref:SAF domain-containing protein n=1 Tax=Streptantibioticus ferralitis TaxID=236510 RepID=A0ABT5Z7T6_9ACTN|nr:SAF domain-containing protein [Streptantibioticus ferralitis]MDF2259697.1 SAF domain-containing protein [Streptantibioticus ferralitis]
MSTSTPSLPPQAQPGGRFTAQLPSSEGAPKRQRRLGSAALLILLALVGALGAAMLVSRAGHRVNVLAVAKDVPAGQALQASDLTQAAIPADPALSPVSASDESSVVGQRTSVDLKKGSLLTRSELTAGGGVGASQALVGVEVKPGQAPQGELAPGDKVWAVSVPAAGQGTPSGTSPIEGQVVSVGTLDSTGAMVVNLAVAPSEATALAQRAGTGAVALVREPRS